MDDFNTIVRLQDTNGIEHELILLKIDAPNGRALVDLDSFDEHWIPLTILDDSASRAEWAAFEALYAREPELRAVADREPCGLRRFLRNALANERRAAFRVIAGGER